jgi:NhaP-type Na+/H+ or K+/H+ antiporter
MLASPAIAFLIGESTGVSGNLTLVYLCLILRLYAKPNMAKERSDFLKVFTTSITHLFK